MDLIAGVSLEDLILGDQTFGAFGKKHLVAELDGRAHLAALDQIGMRLEDRIDFHGIGDLLAVEEPLQIRVNGHPVEDQAKLFSLLLEDFQSVKSVGVYDVYRRDTPQ